MLNDGQTFNQKNVDNLVDSTQDPSYVTGMGIFYVTCKSGVLTSGNAAQ